MYFNFCSQGYRQAPGGGNQYDPRDGGSMSSSQMPRMYKSNNRVVYPKKKTSYNMNARKGFKYWYDERPPGLPCK